MDGRWCMMGARLRRLDYGLIGARRGYLLCMREVSIHPMYAGDLFEVPRSVSWRFNWCYFNVRPPGILMFWQFLCHHPCYKRIVVSQRSQAVAFNKKQLLPTACC